MLEAFGRAHRLRKRSDSARRQTGQKGTTTHAGKSGQCGGQGQLRTQRRKRRERVPPLSTRSARVRSAHVLAPEPEGEALSRGSAKERDSHCVRPPAHRRPLHGRPAAPREARGVRYVIAHIAAGPRTKPLTPDLRHPSPLR
jgi:hypothetical protein